jgi:hypothetical protein
MRKAGFLTVFFIGLLLSLFFYSCQKRPKTKQELSQYIAEPAHGLIQSEQRNEIDFSLQYHPEQLFPNGLKSAGRHTGHKPALFTASQVYFMLNLSAHHRELLRQLDFQTYSALVQLFAFNMADYIVLYPDNEKSVTPLACNFQQTYGMGTANQILIAFDRAKLLNSKKMTIVLKEFGLKTGDIKFEFQTDKIKNAPIITD